MGDEAMKPSPPADGSSETAALVDRYTSVPMPPGDKGGVGWGVGGLGKGVTRENKQIATPANPP